jgi:hypothetical protein
LAPDKSRPDKSLPEKSQAERSLPGLAFHKVQRNGPKEHPESHRTIQTVKSRWKTFLPFIVGLLSMAYVNKEWFVKEI